MVFSVVGVGGLAKTILKSPQKSGILWNADWMRMILSSLYFSLWFFILLLFIFIIFFCKILEILYVVVAFCFLLLFCFLLIGFFLFWLFCYLGVQFFLVFWFFFFFWSLNMKILSNQTISFVKGCCCSCMINILGGERFGCLTNGDTMEVESFFFFFLI